MTEKTEKPVIKKLIDLPRETVEQLKKKAKADKRDVKKYIENLVIEHAANPFKK